MHAHQKPGPSLYEQLEALPEGLTGEILNGQRYTQPRPSGPIVFAATELGYELVGPFERGRGGPGGWWIVQEPELHFLRNTEVDVPDLAGWRKERLPRFPRDCKSGVRSFLLPRGRELEWARTGARPRFRIHHSRLRPVLYAPHRVPARIGAAPATPGPHSGPYRTATFRSATRNRTEPCTDHGFRSVTGEYRGPSSV